MGLLRRLLENSFPSLTALFRLGPIPFHHGSTGGEGQKGGGSQLRSLLQHPLPFVSLGQGLGQCNPESRLTRRRLPPKDAADHRIFGHFDQFAHIIRPLTVTGDDLIAGAEAHNAPDVVNILSLNAEPFSLDLFRRNEVPLHPRPLRMTDPSDRLSC